MILGEKIAMLRQAKGWSQRELSRRAMVPQSLLSALERGKQQDAPGQVIRRLALVLQVSTDYLHGMYDEL